jgi:hypothetical protein
VAHDDLLTACKTALGVLCDRFGFDEPTFEQIGHEHYVEFHKGPRTVSVSLEPGGSPVIELFYPSSDTGDAPAPWASRGDTPYSRRIPRLRVYARSRPRNVDELASYLHEAAQELCATEHGFLAQEAV